MTIHYAHNYNSIASTSEEDEESSRGRAATSNRTARSVRHHDDFDEGNNSNVNFWRCSNRSLIALVVVLLMVTAASRFDVDRQWSWASRDEDTTNVSASALLAMSKKRPNESKMDAESTKSSTSSSGVVDASAMTLSERGRTVKPGRDDILMFQTAAADAYDPEENPDGYLVMIVAENRLMYEELASKLEAVMTNVSIPEWAFDYGQMGGHRDFRAAVARMMESSWIKGGVRPDNLVLQAGAGAVLDNLAWTLADAGDGVLINAPAYSNFAGDFDIHGRLVMHVARTQPENNYEPTLDELEQAYAASVAAGNSPKIYVICQPNNPVGVIYSHAAMKQMITWALQKGLHVVSDEIYANSAFPGQRVTSAAQIMRELSAGHDNNYLTDKVHIVAGLSKDWGMSGFRVGSLFTHNQALLQAMNTLSYYNSVSEYTQYALTAMLSDEEWRDWYLAENRRKLKEVFDAASDALSSIGVQVFPSSGAHFVWADFSSFLLPGQTEKQLWLELFHDARILFAAGESFFENKPGMFRVVYPWPKGGTLAMEEMGKRLVRWNDRRNDNNRN